MTSKGRDDVTTRIPYFKLVLRARPQKLEDRDPWLLLRPILRPPSMSVNVTCIKPQKLMILFQPSAPQTQAAAPPSNTVDPTRVHTAPQQGEDQMRPQTRQSPYLRNSRY